MQTLYLFGACLAFICARIAVNIVVPKLALFGVLTFCFAGIVLFSAGLTQRTEAPHD